jgi:hypothetical protein
VKGLWQWGQVASTAVPELTRSAMRPR